MATPKRPIAVPPTNASARPARPPPSSATRETSTHGDDREPDPDEDERRREPSRHDAGDDRDDRGKDARDRRDDAHPADRQPAIERRDADPAEEPGDEADEQVVPGSGTTRRGAGRARGESDHADEPARPGRRRRPALAGSRARRRSRRHPTRPRRPRPRTTVAAPGGSPSIRPHPPMAAVAGVAKRRVLDAFVDGRGSGQLDDRVGRGVVAVGGRQVDDLEVGRRPA